MLLIYKNAIPKHRITEPIMATGKKIRPYIIINIPASTNVNIITRKLSLPNEISCFTSMILIIGNWNSYF